MMSTMKTTRVFYKPIEDVERLEHYKPGDITQLQLEIVSTIAIRWCISSGMVHTRPFGYPETGNSTDMLRPKFVLQIQTPSR